MEAPTSGSCVPLTYYHYYRVVVIIILMMIIFIITITPLVYGSKICAMLILYISFPSSVISDGIYTMSSCSFYYRMVLKMKDLIYKEMTSRSYIKMELWLRSYIDLPRKPTHYQVQKPAQEARLLSKSPHFRKSDHYL